MVEKTSDTQQSDNDLGAVEPGQHRKIREITAQIAAEQDHDKFTALVEEFNEFLDGKQASQESPKHVD